MESDRNLLKRKFKESYDDRVYEEGDHKAAQEPSNDRETATEAIQFNNTQESEKRCIIRSTDTNRILSAPKRQQKKKSESDANKLCDRLRLLVSLQRAGVSGYKEEIDSILEKLFEYGIIV